MKASPVIHELNASNVANMEAEATAFLETIEAGQTDGVSCWRSAEVERRGGSEIEGVGLFATADIPANTLVAIKQGHVVDKDFIKDNPDIVRGSHQQIERNQFLAGTTPEEVDKNLVGYNHSCDPNAKVVLVPGVALSFLVSRKPITAGDEITADYSVSQMSDTHRMFGCHCGNDACRGIIQPGWDWQDPEFQALYPGEFPDYMQHEIDEYNALPPDEKQARLRTYDYVLRMADLIALSRNEIADINTRLDKALKEHPLLLRPILRRLFGSKTEVARDLKVFNQYLETATNYFAVLCPFANIEDMGVDRQHPERMRPEQREQVVQFALQLDRNFN